MPYFKHLAGLGCMALLTACAALSPYSSLTKLDLTLTASNDLNPDLHGRPSPVVLRLLELKHPVAFENADFFSLYDRPKAALAADLVSMEELELSPGKHIDLKLSARDGSRYLGVMAAYRDLPETQWRYVVTLSPGGITRARLVLDEHGIYPPTDVQASTGGAR